MFKVVVALIVLIVSDLYPSQAVKKVLVIGCGRSGTTYISKFFQLSGLDVHHESSRGTDGCASWCAVANCYDLFENSIKDMQFEHVLHQVRHPLDVISSWVTNFSNLHDVSWKFIRKHTPEIYSYDSLLVQSAKYWYYWNLRAEKMAEWRYRVEDLPFILPEFGRRINYPFDAAVFSSLSNRTNAWNVISNKLTWKSLRQGLPMWLFKQIQVMAFRYGYSITDDAL